MPEIVALGEVLVDFTHESHGDIVTYRRNAGGSPANVAVAAERLGVHSGFIGKVGGGIFGDYLYKTLSGYGVDTSGIVRDRDRLTALAFVRNLENGKREYTFYRENTADMFLRFSEVNKPLIENAEILHFGALMLSCEPSRSAVANSIEFAKDKGKIVSYALNYRPTLWKNVDEAAIAMRSVLSFVDILKVSEDELELISDSSNLLPSLSKILKTGVKIVLVTQGAKGCIIATRNGIREVRSFKTPIVDTLGAGDSFLGAFLAKISQNAKNFDSLTMETLEETAHYANAAGALCSSKIGAIPAMPTNEEILMTLTEVKS
ncbi:MAG: carbohydrate kinase [Ruminococcus sp.]|nr:carbohydrate kinase [Ruminococcus sp.]